MLALIIIYGNFSTILALCFSAPWPFAGSSQWQCVRYSGFLHSPPCVAVAGAAMAGPPGVDGGVLWWQPRPWRSAGSSLGGHVLARRGKGEEEGT